MRRPFIKVCGITRSEDARAAVHLGARALGFVFVPGSPRRVSPEAARDLGSGLPPGVARVGVVADLDVEAVHHLVTAAGLTAIQAHGSESPERCAAYGVPVIKAFPAGPGFDPAVLEPYRAFPVLLDGGREPARGGSGARADWGAAREAVGRGLRVLLAGGLEPATLRTAVEAVGPLGVDLNSGVESAPGVKVAARIAAAVASLASLEPFEDSAWPW